MASAVGQSPYSGLDMLPFMVEISTTEFECRLMGIEMMAIKESKNDIPDQIFPAVTALRYGVMSPGIGQRSIARCLIMARKAELWWRKCCRVSCSTYDYGISSVQCCICDIVEQSEALRVDVIDVKLESMPRVT